MILRQLLLGLGALAAAVAASAQEAAPVRLNQLGLLPEGPKRAIVPHPSKRPIQWQLVDSAGKSRSTGATTVFGKDSDSGEHVHRIDFSGVKLAGRGFHLRLGEMRSRPFAIDAGHYRRLPYDALAYFYHNRAGTPIEARLVGERWARPAGHPREIATCLVKTDSNGNAWPGCAHSLDVTGGWYDAGDHGKYVVNGGISLWTLLNLHELELPLFADGSAAIPEAGNGISDLLDEARWQMEFMLRMQVPSGSRQRLPVGHKRNGKALTFVEVHTSGMAHHKVADENWTALPMRPDRDPEKRQLFPPSTGATLNLAATAAQCARIWRAIDRAFAARCLAAAERAWVAARRNPEVYPIADFTGSGGYGDEDFSDEFYWAAAELLVTTGNPDYAAEVRASPWFHRPIASEAGWNSVAALGSIALALRPAAVGTEQASRLRSAIAAAADLFLAERERNGYGVPKAGKTVWGSTSNLLNRALLIALAHDFTGRARYRDGVIDAMDYLLGRNPLDRSFVTGYGARPMRNPHHRFWANQIDPAFPPPPPGALAGGPNNSSSPRSDEAVGPPAGCAAQTCWVDDSRSFTTNEVAINWNAPLVWVSAWLAARSAEWKRGERG